MPTSRLLHPDWPIIRTVSDIRAALRAALTRAQAEDLITKNAAVPVTLATVRRRRGKSWSSDEARKFLESARADEDPLYAASAQEQRDEAEAAAGKAWHETGLVFTTRYGTPIEPRNFQRSWQTRHDMAKIRPITVHDARRICATLLADLDVHPGVAMQVLLHASSR